jgi:hypothetical protein
MTAFRIFVKHPTADAYRVGGSYSPYCLVSQNKRFRDGELAAEVWHSIVRFNGLLPGPGAAEEARRNMVIERFANYPHYDDE